MVYRVLPRHPEVELIVYSTADPQSGVAFRKWKAAYVPMWVLKDADGKVLVADGGGLPEQNLEQALAGFGM